MGTTTYHASLHNYESEIDNIINDYKKQFEVIKTTSSSINNNQPVMTALHNTSSSLPISSELSLEIQNDNLKLQSQLMLYKSQVLANKKEIKKLSDKIISLEQDKLNKEKQYNTVIQELQNKSKIENIKQTNYETQLMKAHVQHDSGIINKILIFLIIMLIYLIKQNTFSGRYR